MEYVVTKYFVYGIKMFSTYVLIIIIITIYNAHSPP